MKRIVILFLAAVLLAGMTGCSAGKAAGMLTAEGAKSAALEHAGFSAEEVSGLGAEYDVQRGVPVYEVEFTHRGREYEYHISAENGQILYWE